MTGPVATGPGSASRRRLRPSAAGWFRRTRSMVSAIPPAGRWCAVIGLLNAMVWSFLVPPFHVPDETAHYAYAESLAIHGEPPMGLGTDPYPPDERAVINATGFELVVRAPRNRASIPEDRRKVIDQANRTAPGGSWKAGTTNASSQAPLYYALEAAAWRLTPGGHVLTRLALMRFVSALMAGLTVLLVFLFLREVIPSTRWAWTVGALTVAFTPLFAFISGGVNPDALLFTVSAALFLVVARAFRHGLTPQLGAWAGAVIAIGALTKISFVGMIPGAALALLVVALRSPAERRAGAWRGAAWAVLVAALPLVAYAALNLLVWDRPAYSGSVGVVTSAADTPVGSPGSSLTDSISYVWQLYLPRTPNLMDKAPGFPLRDLWADGFIGLFGWLDYGFPDWVYDVGRWVLVAIGVLAIASLARSAKTVADRWMELACYALIALGLLVEIGVVGLRYRNSTGTAFEQARYLLPLLPLYAAAVAMAARAAGRRWGVLLGAALVALAMAHNVFAELLTISRYNG